MTSAIEKAPGGLGPCPSNYFAEPAKLKKNYNKDCQNNSNGCTPKVGIHEIAARCEAVTGNRVKIKNGCFRSPCPAHMGKNHNLVVWQNDDGTIGTKCYSHGCDRKDIIEALGFTLSDILPGRTPTEAQQQKVFRNRVQIESELMNELLLLWKILSQRKADRINKHCQEFREENPEWTPIPEEPWEREVLAKKRIMAGLGAYYGK